MLKFAQTCERIAGTTKKLEKVAIVGEYIKSCPIDQAVVSAVFLSGRPFPVWEETTLNVGGTLLWRVVEALSGKAERDLSEAYRRHGDLGAVAAEVLPAINGRDLSVAEIQARFRQIAAARGPADKSALVRELLSQVTPLEAKYILKIMTGDLRIGLKESLVEEAIAKAYGGTLAQVQGANMLLGDIGQTLELAAAGKLAEAKMRLFHPLGFMLASPAESAEEALSYFENAFVEDKYDGIRAQAHCAGGEVKIFSRTRDEITESFPELEDALARIDDVILDGEIVAWIYPENGVPPSEGRARPFSLLQARLGRKKVSDELMRQVPVAYLAFDVLYTAGELVIDRPLSERAKLLEKILSTARSALRSGHGRGQVQLMFEPDELPVGAHVIRAPVFKASTKDELE